MIGRQDPAAITHPLFFYGFVGVALAWQFAFFVIATDLVRFGLMMIPSVLEKLAFGIPAIVLFAERRLSGSDLGLGCVDLFFGVLFLRAFRSTAPWPRSARRLQVLQQSGVVCE